MTPQLDLDDIRAAYKKSWQYAANAELRKHSNWDESKVLARDGKPVEVGIVGIVSKNRLNFEPLGNFQVQEAANWENKEPCHKAKLQMTLLRPSNLPKFAQDWDSAVTNLSAIQEDVAAGKAPRMHFVVKPATKGHASLRFQFPLWQKKTIKDLSDNEIPPSEDEDDNKSDGGEDRVILLEAKKKERATQDFYVPSRLREVFETTAEEWDIRVCPVYKASTGKPVKPKHFLHHLEDALVEIIFSFHHYYFPTQGSRAASNTFTANIQQIKILDHKTRSATTPSTSSPMRSITPSPLKAFVEGSSSSKKKKSHNDDTRTSRPGPGPKLTAREIAKLPGGKMKTSGSKSKRFIIVSASESDGEAAETQKDLDTDKAGSDITLSDNEHISVASGKENNNDNPAGSPTTSTIRSISAPPEKDASGEKAVAVDVPKVKEPKASGSKKGKEKMALPSRSTRSSKRVAEDDLELPQAKKGKSPLPVEEEQELERTQGNIQEPSSPAQQ